MSCWLVSGRTLNKLTSTLLSIHYGELKTFNFTNIHDFPEQITIGEDSKRFITELFNYLHIDRNKLDNYRRLFLELKELNITSYVDRYNLEFEDITEELSLSIPKVYTQPFKNPYQFLKSLNCYMYQSSDFHRDRDFNSIMFSKFEDIEKSLLKVITNKSKDYDKALWE